MSAFRSQSLIGIGDDRLLLEPGSELFSFDDIRFLSWLRNLNDTQFKTLLNVLDKEKQLPLLLNSILYQYCYATKYHLLGEDNRQHFQNLLSYVPEILTRFNKNQRNELILDTIYYNFDTDVSSLPKEEILPFPYNFNLIECLTFIGDIHCLIQTQSLLSPNKLMRAYECAKPDRLPSNLASNNNEGNKDWGTITKLMASLIGKYLKLTSDLEIPGFHHAIACTALSQNNCFGSENASLNIDIHQLSTITCRQQSWVSQLKSEYGVGRAIA